jgi:hypothetical protein
MKKLTPLLLTLLLALAAFGCSAASETPEEYGEQAQLLCTAPPSATGSSGTACDTLSCQRAAFSITGVRGSIADRQRFEVYWNGAWRSAVDFDPNSTGSTLGPTGVEIIGSIGGAGYPPIAKLIFTDMNYWSGPGTKVTAQGTFYGAFPIGNEIAIHGGQVTCASPPCEIDFNTGSTIGKKLTKMQGLNTSPGLFRVSGYSGAGYVAEEFTLANGCE